MKRLSAVAALLVLAPLTGAALAAQARAQNPATAGGPVFRDATESAGVSFRHDTGATGEFLFAEVFGSGVALFDADGDDDLDLYLVQGSAIGEAGRSPLFPNAGPPGDRLLRNDLDRGRLSFTDITEAAGIRAHGYGMGVATGDYDADGDVDLFVANLGANQLWRNEGDGRFVEVSQEAGISGDRWSVSAAFFDYDGDGRLDLFVANYTNFRPASNKRCQASAGYRDYCSPASYDPETDRLYRNLGDGRFEDVTRRVGLAGAAGNGLGVMVGDFDDDGWTDLYVANDEMPNFLWINREGREFEELALVLGAAVSGTGEPEASMGVHAGDYDGDLDLDLFMTHYAHESNTLYSNLGGVFEDRSTPSGLGPPSWARTGFGTAFFDYDNDGWLDVLVVNGAVVFLPELYHAGDPWPFHEPNQLFRNRRDGRFEEVRVSVGDALLAPHASRGAAFGDVDNDGDTDVVITNNNGPAQLLDNVAGEGSRWLGLRLIDRHGSGAFGAKVTLSVGERRLLRVVQSAGSYASASDSRLLFGLGDGEPDRIEIVWPDGQKQLLDPPLTNRYHRIVQPPSP